MIKMEKIKEKECSIDVLKLVSQLPKKCQELESKVLSLTTELEYTRTSYNSLKMQLSKFNQETNPSIAVLYTQMKEKLEEYQSENSALKDKLSKQCNELLNSFNAEKEVLLKDCFEKMEKQRIEFEEKEKNTILKFHSQMASTSAHEKQLQNSLCVSENKVKELNTLCTSLRNELFHMKSRLNSAVADQKVHLEQKLRQTEAKLTKIQSNNSYTNFQPNTVNEHLWNTLVESNPDQLLPSLEEDQSGYTPLQINTEHHSSAENFGNSGIQPSCYKQQKVQSKYAPLEIAGNPQSPLVVEQNFASRLNNDKPTHFEAQTTNQRTIEKKQSGLFVMEKRANLTLNKNSRNTMNPPPLINVSNPTRPQRKRKLHSKEMNYLNALSDAVNK